MAYLGNQEEENTGAGMNVLDPAQDAQNAPLQPGVTPAPGATPQQDLQG